jgi:hypothetical protein
MFSVKKFGYQKTNGKTTKTFTAFALNFEGAFF